MDTSVWIDHFRKPNPVLIDLLVLDDVLIHSAILGEISAGNLKNRSKILGDLKMIPKISEINAEEVMEFIENNKLHGLGLSWADLQILASALAARCNLLTQDKKLASVFLRLR